MEEKKSLKKELERVKRDFEQEAERESILMKADEIKEETFNFDLNGQLELKSEIADILLDGIDNPEEKYSLYYNVLNRLLKKHLPKGEENQAARKLIYEEKNTFLTRGHRKDQSGVRGADGRMSYTNDMHEMVNIITEWITTQGTMYSLYTKLRDLNVSKGYGLPNIER